MKLKEGHKDTSHMTGCGGCLTVFGIPFFLLLVAVTWLFIDDSITRKKYIKDPEAAHREIVEGYAGIEFPHYRMIETIMSPKRGRFEFIDTIRMEFLSLPDSSFYERLGNACELKYYLDDGEMTGTYRPWHFDKERNKYHFRFNAFYNQTMYDSIRSIFLSRGVPREFLAGDRLYEIHLPVGSMEWKIVTGIH